MDLGRPAKNGDGREKKLQDFPMFADRHTFRTANSALTANWRLSIKPYLFRAFAGMVRTMARWATTPVLPYAALREASVVARLAAESVVRSGC